MSSRKHVPLKAVPTSQSAVEALRLGVGFIWLAGAVWNLLVTRRMADPFGWLVNGSRFAFWRWIFGEVVMPHRSFWTAILIVGETALGVLTLARGGWAKLGLLGGALFSAALFTFGTTYTLMMGPYTCLLAWLARHQFGRSLVDFLRGRR